MKRVSNFSRRHGILFAADLENERQLFEVLDDVADHIDAIKIGNVLLYASGLPLISRVKKRYPQPVVADLKLTDVSHIATRVVTLFRDEGADAIILAGICGPRVVEDAVAAAGESCEIWAFTEFTNDTGLIDETLADCTAATAVRSGVVALQVPGTRPHRVEVVRSELGSDVVLFACGIGVQGAPFGPAIAAGANLEIIGRAIYRNHSPGRVASEARRAIHCAAVSLAEI